MTKAFLALALVLFTGFSAWADPAADFFVGRWFAKPVHDSQLFMADVFTGLDIKADGTLTFSMYILHQEGSQPPVAILYHTDEAKTADEREGKIKGTYQLVNGTLRCTSYYWGTYVLVRINALSFECSHVPANPGEKSTTYYRADAAPWAKVPVVTEIK